MPYLLVNDVLDTLAIRLLFLFVMLHVGLRDEFALLGQCGYHGVLVNDIGIVLVFVLPLRSGLLLTRLLLLALCIGNDDTFMRLFLDLFLDFLLSFHFCN